MLCCDCCSSSLLHYVVVLIPLLSIKININVACSTFTGIESALGSEFIYFVASASHLLVLKLGLVQV